MVKPRVVFLIFVSGKIVLTGAKTEIDLTAAYEKLYPVLVEYKKSDVTAIPSVPEQVENYEHNNKTKDHDPCHTKP